ARSRRWPAADQVLPARGPGRLRRRHRGGALGGQPGPDLRKAAPGGGGPARPKRSPMTDRIADSVLYRHLWGTDEARAVLGEEGRLAGWLEGVTGVGRVPGEGGA